MKLELGRSSAVADSKCNMRFGYKTPSIGRLCNSHHSLVEKFGEAAANVIKKRLYWLSAAQSLADVPTDPPDLRKLENGSYPQMYSVDVKSAGRIFFEAVGDMVNDEIGLDSIREIVIVRVGARS